MPRYDFGCYKCMVVWEIVMSMKEIDNHMDPCPICGEKVVQKIGAPGMIRVTGGASPTRVGKKYARSDVGRGNDPGFLEEFESIYEDDPIHDPNTGEKYEYSEHPETGLRCAVTPSQAEQYRARKEFVEHHVEMVNDNRQAYREMIDRTKDSMAESKEKDAGKFQALKED